jgi:iron-sulfur cluster repair protein YtfE (RIC family)
MNVIELLKADHEKVAELFEQFKANEDGDNGKLFTKIKAELDVHAHVEETVFYPKMKADGNEELQKLVLEGVEEHRQMKMFLRELAALQDESEKFNPKLKVLVEDTEHHVEEEEEEMFPLVEAQFDAAQLDELGAAVEAEKARFNKTSAAAG